MVRQFVCATANGMVRVMKRNFSAPRSIIFINRLFAIMEGERLSAREMADRMHCEISGIHQYLRYLTSTPRRVYIAAWRQNDTGCPAPLYRLGNRKDAPRPPVMTNAERKAKRRAINADRVNAGQRHSYMLRAIKEKPAGIFAALGL